MEVTLLMRLFLQIAQTPPMQQIQPTAQLIALLISKWSMAFPSTQTFKSFLFLQSISQSLQHSITPPFPISLYSQP
jgi:hypothetical protein